MRFVFPVSALLWTIFLLPVTIAATTIVPYANLGEATANSECVVLARAMAPVETAEGDKIFRSTHFKVLETVKGDLVEGQLFSLRPLSYHMGDYDVDVAGDFEATIDKEYLLFLRRKGDVWVPVMLSYYVFQQILVGTDAFLMPVTGAGIEVIAAPGAAQFEPLAVYQTGLLLDNLRQFSHTTGNPWDGSIGRTQLQVSDLIALDRTVPVGCDFMLGNSNFLARWVNATVPIFADNTGLPAGWTAYFTNIASAMTSNYPGINPTNGGITAYDPTCVGGPDFVNFCNNNLGGPQCALILFDDPCDEMLDLSNCSGVLAYGGSFTSSNSHTFDGQTWQNASYGYVTVNVGAEPCYPGTDFERMMTHELTHVYRMDHLDPALYPLQNMNPNCCNAISTKDQECMNYAYPSGLPVALVSFEARLYDNQKVVLKWVTQSEKDNAFFTLKRSVDGIQFERLAELPGLNATTGGNYEWVDQHPLPGVNYYLLSQTDLNGTAVHLAIKSVNVQTAGPVVRIIPNPVENQMLRFRADFPTAFDGQMQVVDKDGKIVLSSGISLEPGSNWIQQPLEGLLAGIYTLRVFDARQQFSARFTKK